MYKDKEKQRQANRESAQRRRDKRKGMTKGMTRTGMTQATDILERLNIKTVPSKGGPMRGYNSEPPDTAPTTQSTDEHADAEGTKTYEVVVTSAGHGTGKLSAAFDKALTSLPPEPTRPTGSPTAATANMTAQQLKTRLSLYHGLDWVASPIYAEIIYRLLTQSLDDLTASGQSIPAWKQNAA